MKLEDWSDTCTGTVSTTQSLLFSATLSFFLVFLTKNAGPTYIDLHAKADFPKLYCWLQIQYTWASTNPNLRGTTVRQWDQNLMECISFPTMSSDLKQDYFYYTQVWSDVKRNCTGTNVRLPFTPPQPGGSLGTWRGWDLTEEKQDSLHPMGK